MLKEAKSLEELMEMLKDVLSDEPTKESIIEKALTMCDKLGLTPFIDMDSLNKAAEESLEKSGSGVVIDNIPNLVDMEDGISSDEIKDEIVVTFDLAQFEIIKALLMNTSDKRIMKTLEKAGICSADDPIMKLMMKEMIKDALFSMDVAQTRLIGDAIVKHFDTDQKITFRAI